MVMRNRTLESLEWAQVDPGDLESYISGREVIGGDLLGNINRYNRSLGRRVNEADGVEIYFSGRDDGPHLAVLLDAGPPPDNVWGVDYPIRVYVAWFTDDLVTSEDLERLVTAGED